MNGKNGMRSMVKTLLAGLLSLAAPLSSWADIVNIASVTYNDIDGIAHSRLSNSVTTTVIQNQAPVVQTGGDQMVPLQATLTLDGSVSDDGLPANGGIQAVTWSQ